MLSGGVLLLPWRQCLSCAHTASASSVTVRRQLLPRQGPKAGAPTQRGAKRRIKGADGHGEIFVSGITALGRHHARLHNQAHQRGEDLEGTHSKHGTASYSALGCMRFVHHKPHSIGQATGQSELGGSTMLVSVANSSVHLPLAPSFAARKKKGQTRNQDLTWAQARLCQIQASKTQGVLCLTWVPNRMMRDHQYPSTASAALCAVCTVQCGARSNCGAKARSARTGEGPAWLRAHVAGPQLDLTVDLRLPGWTLPCFIARRSLNSTRSSIRLRSQTLFRS